MLNSILSYTPESIWVPFIVMAIPLGFAARYFWVHLNKKDTFLPSQDRGGVPSKYEGKSVKLRPVFEMGYGVMGYQVFAKEDNTLLAYVVGKSSKVIAWCAKNKLEIEGSFLTPVTKSEAKKFEE